MSEKNAPHSADKAGFALPLSTSRPTPPTSKSSASSRARAFLLWMTCVVLFLYFSFSPFFLSSTSGLSGLAPWRGRSCTSSSGTAELDQWIDKQEMRAMQGVVANVGEDGAEAGPLGALPGIVIASPSTIDPDYVYTWTRDAALVTKALLNRVLENEDSSLLSILSHYTKAQAVLQHVDNPSGTFETQGLGEPKFEINETAFTGSWGRPQNDGPALRATTLINYAYLLLNQSENDFVHSTLVPIITADLDYTVTWWNTSSFDLWEEVRGSSFFTTAVQHRALREGAAFFSTINSPQSKYAQAADKVLCFLQDYWSPDNQYVLSNIDTDPPSSRTGLDGNSILASIHTFDRESLTCDEETFQPCSSRALSNHKAVVDSFRHLYPLNSAIPSNKAVAVGRYGEDVYYGGNPWYILTLAAAEQLYDALWTWEKAGGLNVTETSRDFFASLRNGTDVGTYSSTEETYREIVEAVRVYADGFIEVVQKYTPKDGSMAEQFQRTTGKPDSATDLTWSYASFVTAIAARKGQHPPGWGSSNLTLVCPPRGEQQVTVVFRELVVTNYGDNIFVVGSIEELGSWDPERAIPLTAKSYTAANPTWTASVQLPAETAIQFKFLRKTSNGVLEWEAGENRSIVTVKTGRQDVVTAWQS